ncbi:MAG: CopG family transcriptional regulator [Pseudomonadota bacterium]
MGQVTIYLDNELESKVQQLTKSMHISKSKWVAQLIKEKIADEWPESVKNLAGAWTDLPSAEEIREGLGEDIKREGF